MWTGFRNEHETNDIPDLETGSIPQGIDCVPGKAAPKGRKRWRPRTREERSQINWMKRGGGPYYWRDLKSFQELKDDQKRKGPSCSSLWQEHSWTKHGPCISQLLSQGMSPGTAGNIKRDWHTGSKLWISSFPASDLCMYAPAAWRSTVRNIVMSAKMLDRAVWASLAPAI